MRNPCVVLLAGLLIGCASPVSPAVPKPDSSPVETEEIAPGPTSVQSEIGGLNEEAVSRAFKSLSVQGCLAQASEKLDALGGEFKIRLRIDRDGFARAAYMSESTLGDRDAERCVLDLAMAKRWPKPLGGDGIAESSYAFDAQNGPVVLDTRRMGWDIARARAKARSCRRNVAGTFMATVYLRRDGRVERAGVASPNETAEGAADCIVDAISKLRFRGTTKKIAKMSFPIP